MPREPLPEVGQQFLTNGLGRHPERVWLPIERVDTYRETTDSWNVGSGRKQYSIKLVNGQWEETDERGAFSPKIGDPNDA